jgi:hypothetical protein
MIGIFSRSILIALSVSLLAVGASLVLGYIYTPYSALTFGFVPEHLSNGEFMSLMGKAFIWLFSVSLMSSLVTLYLYRAKPIYQAWAKE